MATFSTRRDGGGDEGDWGKKVRMKKQELRFNCINALPAGEVKTNLLLDMLQSEALVDNTSRGEEEQTSAVGMLENEGV